MRGARRAPHESMSDTRQSAGTGASGNGAFTERSPHRNQRRQRADPRPGQRSESQRSALEAVW